MVKRGRRTRRSGLLGRGPRLLLGPGTHLMVPENREAVRSSAAAAAARARARRAPPLPLLARRCSCAPPPTPPAAAPTPAQDHTLAGTWSFLVKEHVQCLCEGGRACAKEDPARQAASAAAAGAPRPPFAGLHASWVAPRVLAMARPWKDSLERHDVARQFQEAGIGLVINLQEVRVGGWLGGRGLLRTAVLR
jgi:hypothetical protein